MLLFIVPPFGANVIVYLFIVQFAVYDLFPVLPFVILTLFCGVVPFDPVHPVNVYPVFVGSARVMSLLSTVYDVGFPDAFVPSFKVYEIVYVTIVHFAVAVNAVPLVGVIDDPAVLTALIGALTVQPSNVYPVLVIADANVNDGLLYVDIA